MKDTQYRIDFEKLCHKLELGALVVEPSRISGGLLHRMYEVKTSSGRYAIKALNPNIMQRPVAMKHYISSEEISEIAAKEIPALPSKKFCGRFMHELDGQYYLIFDWIEGKSLKSNEINTYHSEKLGEILGKIHSIDFSKVEMDKDPVDNMELTNWSYYLVKGKESNSVWTSLLEGNLDNLYEWNKLSSKADILLSEKLVVSHRDMDPKNVMWMDNNPIIIDWESAGYVNPMFDLLETAIYWSVKENGDIDKERFFSFFMGYRKINKEQNTDWRMVLEGGYSGKLGWLEYNFKRSLGLECTDKAEQQLGTEEVLSTIALLKQYEKQINEIEKWV